MNEHPFICIAILAVVSIYAGIAWLSHFDDDFAATRLAKATRYTMRAIGLIGLLVVLLSKAFE